jgi:hypothetical protein
MVMRLRSSQVRFFFHSAPSGWQSRKTCLRQKNC